MADWLRDAATVDFEALPTDDRSGRSPAPVGVAVHVPGQRPRYLSWGHAVGQNNSTWADGRRVLGDLYASGRPILGHNILKFDRAVGEDHLGLPALPWDRVHDTLPLLFLDDPRAPDFQLKKAAERRLGEKPEERDAVVSWLVDHQPVPGVKLSDKPKSDNYAGAYTAFAPAELVGRYAIGDVTRTRALAEAVWPLIVTAQMQAPYDVERELAPHILGMERRGLRVDLKRLTRDVERYDQALGRLDAWLRRKLRVDLDTNLDSGPQLTAAMIAAGLAAEADFGYTTTGKVQTNKAALTAAIGDKTLLAALKYRTQLHTCLNTFMKPWLEMAVASGGYVFCRWHSTRQDRGDAGLVGTRTGRLSSTPNLMNIPKEFIALFREHAHDKAEAARLPRAPCDLPPLPLVRSYVIPYVDGDVLLDRDYSQQEPRILAHYEGGALLRAYQADPRRDFHSTVQQQLADRGIVLERKPVKNLNLGLIYGMGLGKLAERVGRSVEETKQIKAAVWALYPGLGDMYAEMRRRAAAGEPIRTWDGRVYYCEEPKFDPKKKRVVTFDYKLVNLLIQGSAAGCTKRAMLNYLGAAPARWPLLLTVHDELAISAPRREATRAMALLKEAMESVKFDVAMLTEGTWSATDWQHPEDYDDVKGLAA